MHDLKTRILAIDTGVAEIDEDLSEGFAGVFEQEGGLLQLRRENVPIVRIAEEGPGADHQTALVGDDDLPPIMFWSPGRTWAEAVRWRHVSREGGGRV